MRIATWNLDGSWSRDHASVLRSLDCDVLLLTECPVAASLIGYERHATARLMGADAKHWAAILSRSPIESLPDPHPASAAAVIDGLVFCATVLPWPLARSDWPSGSAEHQPRMQETLADLTLALAGRTAVWGGDWNQPLEGNLAGFTRAARAAIAAAIATLNLQVPTASLQSRIHGQCSIDHLAVPSSWTVVDSARLAVAECLSDHDAYWMEVEH